MKKKNKFIIANAILWASMILASSLIFRFTDVAANDAFGYALIVVFIPLYIASEQILRRAMKSNTSAC